MAKQKSDHRNDPKAQEIIKRHRLRMMGPSFPLRGTVGRVSVYLGTPGFVMIVDWPDFGWDVFSMAEPLDATGEINASAKLVILAEKHHVAISAPRDPILADYFESRGMLGQAEALRPEPEESRGAA
jgi:hypothetical protein